MAYPPVSALALAPSQPSTTTEPESPFSTKGDSDSVIVDDFGCTGGLLISGASATLVSFLLNRMKDNGLYKSNANPVLPT